MIPVAVVSVTKLDRGTFMPAAQHITGENHVTDVDARPGLSTLADDLSILRHFSDMEIDLTTAVTYVGVMAAGFREDVENFLVYTRGMPICPTERCRRGTWCVIVSGSLDQWKTAIVDGCRSFGDVQSAYNQLFSRFTNLGLGYLFQDYKTVDRGNQFLLEHK